MKQAFVAARDAMADEAVAEMVAAGLRPIEPFPGVATSWRSVCIAYGHEVSPRLDSVRHGRGCNRSGYIKTARKPQIPADETAAAMRERGIEPLETYPGSKDAKWRCRCTRCGDEVVTTYGTVVHGGGTGCAVCGKRQAARARHEGPRRGGSGDARSQPRTARTVSWDEGAVACSLPDLW